MDILQAPSTPKRKQLTRDQRLQIQTLASTASWAPEAIAKAFQITLRQVEYAIEHRPTPQKQRCGRKALIDTPSRRILLDFIRTSKRTRRMPYFEVAHELNWQASESAIRRALQKEGYHRRISRRKPPISEVNRVARLAWATEHRWWTRD